MRCAARHGHLRGTRGRRRRAAERRSCQGRRALHRRARLKDVRMSETLPQGKQPALRVMPMPADANQNGDIFGGWIMAQVDIAGGTVAGRLARGRVATVAVNSFVFKEPVQVGDVISCYADVVRIGTTSVTIDVQVYAERRPSNPTVVKVTE